MLVLKIVSFYLIAQISAQDSAETVVANAAFEDIAPCPCDLSQGSCDVSCCCDNDCSANEKQTFVSCIPYLAGGQEPQTQQYRCSSTHHQKEDWFPFLCVEFEYNAFLGYFYEWQYKLGNNTQAFLDRLSTVFYFSYREQDARAIVDPNTTVYKFGASVKTRRQSASRIGTLSLPQQVLTGQCLDTAPVRYLKNLDHSCTVRMSVDLCSATSVLSQLYYVQSSTFTSFFSVVEDYSGITVAQTNVVYKCVTNENDLNRYLMSMTPLTVDSSQPSNLQIDPACVGDCGEDLCVNLTRSDPVVPQTVIGNCASQSPQAPTVNAGVCANAVIDVQYNAYWIGNKIAKFDAVIIVANISINNILGSPNVLTQNFKVDFIHNSTNATGEVSDNFYNITDASYTRSGKVGYEKGRGLYSGSAVYNTSTSPRQFLFVNSNGSRQMAVYGPGPDGLCENAGRRNIKFGEDITTACKLQLSIANMSDCTVLRYMQLSIANMSDCTVLR
ncbi:hypothetical protein DPMN_008664 [Dreissena polymorpha]|uniref:Tectonic domain-containing protein n=1 Tax=Dreissena polymorpha TaxID=45954 RepID=A0A9D4MYI0_DREPO|nr:hypothetical protein DPMN_008664 [Dreissena polymorpha]